jgi:hypothetical protein
MVRVPSVTPSYVGSRRKECSGSLGPAQRVRPEFAEVIKADVTIETTKRAYTDDFKKVAFNGATPMRARSLDASAVGTIAFHRPLTPKFRRTRSLAEPGTSANSQAGAQQSVLGSDQIIPTNRDSRNTENHVSRFIGSHPY